MKRCSVFCLALCLVLGLTACGGPAPVPTATPVLTPYPTPEEVTPVELTVFAAASLTESLTAIAEDYKTVAPHVTLTFNFDSSGTLKTQLEAGAVCDLFLSAAQKQMDALDPTSGEENGSLTYIDPETRVDLLDNQVVLIVPQSNPAGVTSFQEAGDQASLMAVGGADVPVGQYAQEIFTTLGLWESLNADHKLTFSSNVKEVLAQVAEGAADCGVVYATDAAAQPDVTVVATAPDSSCQPVVYPAAVLVEALHPEEGAAFLAYLQQDEAGAVFEAAGFTPLGE